MRWQIATFVLAVALVVLLVMHLTSPAGSAGLVATGLGVLSAVSVMAILRAYEASRSAVDMKQLHEDISSLGNKLRGIKNLGIYRFDQRAAFGDAYWIEQIGNVAKTCSKNTKLVLVGRDLDNWINATFSDLFYDAIVKILKSGGSIRIITLDPSGNAGQIYKETTGRDLAVAARELEVFFSDRVKPSVTREQYGHLEKKMTSDVQLTFTMFRSDAMLWVSPYLSLRDSASNLALSCGLDSPLAQAVLNDFNALWPPKPEEVQ